MAIDLTRRYMFSVEEWHQMGQAGLFDEDARVELLDGEVTLMAPIGDRHALCVTRLARLFHVMGADRAVVSVQNPVVLDNRSEPQPDLALLRPPLERYTAHPRPEDVLLLVEVADTTMVHDRDRKALLYARSGITETWVVDLVAQEILMLWTPGPSGYSDSHRAGRDEMMELQELPGLLISVDDVLGPPGPALGQPAPLG